MQNITLTKLICCLALCPVLLTGCGDEFSGDKYKAVEAKHVQNVASGVIVSIRNVKIKRHEGMGAGAAAGGVGGAVAGNLLGNAFGGDTGGMVGMALGAVAGGIGGNAIQNRNVEGREYTVKLDNGNTVAITQGPTPQLSVGQRVNVHYDASGARRVVPAQ